MKFFLVVYDRSKGELRDAVREFAESERERALAERFRQEAAERDHPEIEVVLLGAESRADLERTHARYFKTLEQIASSS